MQLTPHITALPVLHGSHVFAAEVRRLCSERRFDCIAIDLPSCFTDALSQAVDTLPFISIVAARTYDDDTCFFVPNDPCDAMIEGVRQSRSRRMPLYGIGHPQMQLPKPLPHLPDEQAVTSIGFDAFCALCLQVVGNPVDDNAVKQQASHIAAQTLELQKRFESILILVHAGRFARVVDCIVNNPSAVEKATQPFIFDIVTALVNPDHLYFVLGELPFITGRIESARQHAFESIPDIPALLADLFRETREEYSAVKIDMAPLSPARLQRALTFARNLALSEQRLIPDLFDIVAAAKGVGGNRFALQMLKSAKYYPYLPIESDESFCEVGIDKIKLPFEDHVRPAVNLLRDRRLIWRQISLKHDPSLEKQKEYRYRWNPRGMCSHVPEDRSIESFNTHVRTKALRILNEDSIRSEKFTTSVLDGIDIRETLRNWFTGNVYVRELPPVRGAVDTVVILFDDDHDELYPHQVTWYAEHPQESTLSFYATDPFTDLIGPGIARARYGGLSLVFPPRQVPDLFQITQPLNLPRLSQRLTYGSLLFAREKVVAFVAQKRPDVRLRQMAARQHKQLVWIPLSTFSRETITRLRTFHVLNGKTVRSWASRFIGE